jgi:serine/threonine protein kinase/DNA-binding SARP family transcriptional activator
MEFLILGPLEVSDDGRKLALGGPKQRAVLAHLILRANRLVAADLLIDGLWGDEPPESARNTLQTYVYRLRKVLGDGRLEGRDGGYVLAAAPGEIDAARFEALVNQGKAQVASDPSAAAATLSDALSLWRADALADVTEEPSLRGEAARLEELRLSATEHRVSAEIAMGGHSTVVPELELLTARYPLRERMWANLMLALYRSGRQAEALSTFERARQVLADELGADPSPELQRLHERILDGDPALGTPARGAPEPARPKVRTSRVDLQPGTEVAGYRIERTLGRGGMSVVYLAEHDWLQRKVALKVLAPQLAEDERFRERFVRESRLAASLDHPNVIPIYEAGASGGDLFIAMRYVDGTDLRTLLHESGALEPGKTMAIVRQVAEALDAAHEQGLVHRDVKPGNVLLARQRGSEQGEHVYLSDFGLTKRSASDSGITGTGQFVGTLDYAAPEQFKGGTPDARTDVYSLGCVLFECLTGSPPFTSENDAGLMYAHLQEAPPPVTAARPELLPEIDGVIARAMAKAPEERQASAGTLVDEAARALRVGVPGEAEGSEPLRSRLRRLVPILAVAVALIAGIVVSSLVRNDAPEAASAMGQTSPGTSPSPSPAPPAFRTVQRALKPEEERLLTYIPDPVAADCAPLDRPEPIHDELAALACRSEDVEVLYELFPTRDAMNAAFEVNVNNKRASTGNCETDHLAVETYTIGGRRAGRILCYTITRLGSLNDAEELSQSRVEWTDENASIYAQAVRNDLGDLSLYEWWVTSSGPLLPSEDAVRTKDQPLALADARLRDGTYLVTPKNGCVSSGATCALHVDGTSYWDAFGAGPNESGTLLLEKPNRVVFVPASGYCFTAGQDPRSAAYTVRGTNDALTFHNARGGTCAGPRKMVSNRAVWTRAPAGTIALELQGEITLMDPGGAEVEALAPDTQTRRKDPDWSPDASKIVFAEVTAQGDDDLYLMNADGSGRTQLTDEKGDEYDPAWSPDGSLIAFGFDDLGYDAFSTSIFIVDPRTGELTELVTKQNERLGWPAWSPDGRRIAFSAYSQTGWDLYVMDADGGNLTKVAGEPRGLFGMPIAWTPDGRRIVFVSEALGYTALFTMRADGSDARELFPDLRIGENVAIDWSPDGRWVVAAGLYDQAAIEGGTAGVLLIRADGSQMFKVAAGGSEPSWRPDVS